MDKFKQYTSIENTFRDDFVTMIFEEGLDQFEYVVQEKVHGANLSFWTDGKEVIAAKRTSFLGTDEKFYRFQLILNKYRKNVLEVFQILKEKNNDLKLVTIYGELFGGYFKHPEVKRDKEAIVIQKGVVYCPQNDFYAFDIKINNSKFMDVDGANEVFEKAGFFNARTIFRGSFQEALSHPNMFQSKISVLMNLPELPDNVCEGIVIKPVTPLFLKNGSRVILKNKNEKFAEKKKERKRFVKQNFISDSVKEMSAIIADYVNVNRLNNVISKIGEVSEKDIGRLIGMLNQDAMEDFLKDHASAFDVLEKKDQKMLAKALNAFSAQLIKKEIKNLQS